jgi:hypothetical protein
MDDDLLSEAHEVSRSQGEEEAPHGEAYIDAVVRELNDAADVASLVRDVHRNAARFTVTGDDESLEVPSVRPPTVMQHEREPLPCVRVAHDEPPWCELLKRRVELLADVAVGAAEAVDHAGAIRVGLEAADAPHAGVAEGAVVEVHGVLRGEHPGGSRRPRQDHAQARP